MSTIKHFLDDPKLGEMLYDANPVPTITFDHGDTYEGWYHGIYRVRREGLTFERWDSGGYEKHQEVEERPTTKEWLLAEIKNGGLPLPRWSNKDGVEVLQSLLNEISCEEMPEAGAYVGND